MAATSPLLRPLGIAAGLLGSFQAIIWGILSLLGILTYTEAISLTTTGNPTNRFKEILVLLYFDPRNLAPDFIMGASTVIVWTSIYFSTSVIWLVISGMLLYDFKHSKYTFSILIGWVAVTAAVSMIDFAGMVAFGVDFDNLKDQPDLLTDFLLAPIFLMTMCARGFLLWIMNVGLVIYLGAAARKLKKKKPAELSQRPSVANMNLSSSGESATVRQNPSFQQEPISAWDIQSPTVGDKQRNPWQFSENNSRFSLYGAPESSKILPRVATPVHTPVVPVAPLPIPQPDYSPPLGRPVKHEPNPYDYPLRSALKKPQPYGSTIF